jgi:hypothetical protein
MKEKKKLEIAIEALKQLQEPRGAYSRDRLTHAENTIANVQKIAKDALQKIRVSAIVESGNDADNI